MFAALKNIWNIKELRNRLLFTIGVIVLVRVAALIPCPGVNWSALKDFFQQMRSVAGESGGMLLGIVDIFSGGALENFALATLGIMPYITASIIMQLMVPVFPALEKIQRDGENGRQKINQYTRYLTVLICLIQGTMAAVAMVNPQNINLPAPNAPLFVGNASGFIFMTVVVLTATTMIFMWLGEQVTERGIGNGISIIITIGIIARMPQAVMQLAQSTSFRQSTPGATTLVHLLLLIVLFVAVTAATLLLCQGYRRVPIQMARKAVGNQVQNSTTYMPLKVNFAGVMPIIFAGAIMMIPGVFFQWAGWTTMQNLFGYGKMAYIITEALLILLFSYFWVANQFNPIMISENLKREGAYIPGIRPGNPTADFLDHSMTRITFAGSVFLMFLAILPMILSQVLNVPMLISTFFGGTSLLIMVGVVLETMSQLESHLTMRHYDGFLKSGRLKGRNGH